MIMLLFLVDNPRAVFALVKSILVYVNYLSIWIGPPFTLLNACQSIGLTQFSLLSNKRSARELWSEHWPDRPTLWLRRISESILEITNL